MTDTRTDAERRYDAERDGTLYTNQAPSTDRTIALVEEVERFFGLGDDDANLPDDVKEWIDRETGRVADEPVYEYPQSVDDGEGMLDEQALERLGLAEQADRAVIDEREDGTLICLTGAGEMLIRAPGKDVYALDLKTTAALILFMQGENTKKLFLAILRASLLAQGGLAAELTLWMDEIFDQKERAAGLKAA